MTVATEKRLQGEVAIITGASRGIGAAVARRLVEAGAAVVLTARSPEPLEAVATELRRAGGRALAIAADVSDLEQVEEVVESALDQFGRIDILVNNAAVIWPVEETAETDADEWAYNIHVNLIGAFYMTRAVLPTMLGQRYGRILHVSSRAAIAPIAGFSAYCAAKAGLDMFAQVLALELKDTGVTTNCLYPGMVDTEMQGDIRSVDTGENQLNLSRWHEAYEKGQLTPPADVARLVYWLVGPWSRQRNGEIFKSNDAAWLAQVHRDLNE